MKLRLFALMLLAGSAAFAETRIHVGIGIGAYPVAPPPVMVYAPPYAAPVVAYRPPCPGPDYTWVSGYYYPVGPRRAWRAGYWARPPYARGRRVAPRYYGHRDDRDRRDYRDYREDREDREYRGRWRR